MINFYGKIQGGNFGDDLNDYLWPKLFPKPLSEYLDDNTLFLGIGTRLRTEVIPADKKKIIFGTGYGYSKRPPVVDSSWNVRCVRGPLTAKALGIDPRFSITDSAILVLELIKMTEKKYDFSFIPHHLTISEDNWEPICQQVGVNYINSKWSPFEVITKINQSRIVLTESLHGAILADAYRIPWMPIATRQSIHQFKWDDWAQSIGVDFEFCRIPALYNIGVRSKSNLMKYGIKKVYGKTIAESQGIKSFNKILHSGRQFLSKDSAFDSVYNRLKESFDSLISDLEHSRINFN